MSFRYRYVQVVFTAMCTEDARIESKLARVVSQGPEVAPSPVSFSWVRVIRIS